MPADRAPDPSAGPGRPGDPGEATGTDGPARTPRSRPGRLTPPRRIGAAAGTRRPGTFPGGT
ncbi:MAG TPA: hypothetical protein VFP72_22470, partial [Kineosporiaceae bacterium]|nr:hypothetical protein [Kineosporiaceae bacterium]